MNSKLFSLTVCIFVCVRFASSTLFDDIEKCFSKPEVLELCKNELKNDPAVGSVDGSIEDIIKTSMQKLVSGTGNGQKNDLDADISDCIKKGANMYCSDRVKAIVSVIDSDAVQKELMNLNKTKPK